MADVKISQLPAAALPLTGSEIFPLVQNSVTVQTPVSSVSKAIVVNISDFTGTGTQTIFTLPSSPANLNLTNIYINGVYQNKNTYTLSSSSITFSEAPPYNSIIEAVYL
jgi:hypothetical protein